jgi:Fe-S-cluster containining protein
MTPGDDQLARHWLGALERSEIAAALEGVYADAASAIAARGPACWASGRCCNFEQHGHRLYVTGLEAAWCVAKLPEIAGTRRENFGEPKLRLLVLEDARQRGGCPFQMANLCGVHAIKPLGCRVYFCDRSAQEWQMELSERLIGRVRAIHDQFAIEYRYGEWRDMLGRFV